MLYVPHGKASFLGNNLPTTPANLTGTQLTANATIHTLGTTWVDLIASTPYACNRIQLVFTSVAAAATRTDMLIDIAIGAASGESVILSKIPCGWSGTTGAGPRTLTFPFKIPKGSRISAKLQSLISADTVNVLLFLTGGEDEAVSWTSDTRAPASGQSPQNAEALGINTSLSQGFSYTAAATTGTYPSFTDFPGASGAGVQSAGVTARDYLGVMPLVGGVFSGTVMSSLAYHFQIGIGGVALPGEWLYSTLTTETTVGPFPSWPCMKPIPAGTQLQIRGKCSGAAEALDVAILGLY